MIKETLKWPSLPAIFVQNHSGGVSVVLTTLSCEPSLLPISMQNHSGGGVSVALCIVLARSPSLLGSLSGDNPALDKSNKKKPRKGQRLFVTLFMKT